MSRRRHYLTLVLCMALVGVARLARADGAADYTYQVLFDTDNNALTGCSVPVDDATVGSTTFDGVERLVSVTVLRSGTGGTITGITVQDCVSGTTFGPPQPVSPGGWPVGQGDGVGGGDVIEGFVPAAALGNGGLARVAFTASRATPGSDVMLSTTGELGGAPILFGLPGHAPAPLLSTAGLALSVLLLGGVAWWALRRRSIPPAFLLALAITAGAAATVYALTMSMDGQVGDWGALPPVATDPTHDSTNNDPAEDLVAGFLTADKTNVYFRMDVVTIADLCAAVVCTASDQCHDVGTCDLYTGGARTQRSQRHGVQRRQRLHAERHLSGRRVHGQQPGGLHGAGSVPRRRHLRHRHRGMREPDKAPTTRRATTASLHEGRHLPGRRVPRAPPGDLHREGSVPRRGHLRPGPGCARTPPKPDGTPCDDGNACTQSDTCQAGVCTGSNPVTCSALDQCHDAGTCDTGTGVCSNPPEPDSTSCNDGNACTQSDTCQAGVCTGSNPVTCSALDQCHVAGTCDTTTGVCSNPAKADGTTCDAETDAAQTQICTSGACGTCTAFAGSPRFVDNGDGTITDRSTCLVWEKKDQSGTLHDWGNGYQWSSSGTAADGGAFTVFLAGLNSAGFAGHHDWRLPKEDGLNGSVPEELESILAAPYPCTGKSNPCVDAAFNTNCVASCSATGVSSCSCTQSNIYWSATTTASLPDFAWFVNFDDGTVGVSNKTLNYSVRAVRGGL